MPEDFLRKIVARKREEIADLHRRPETSNWPERARSTKVRGDFHAALAEPGRMRLIAEIKRASPSAGDLRAIPHPTELAQVYANAGADAISVLTDRDFFSGSTDDLAEVSNAVDVPTLRKDFILDPIQIYEAKLLGASAVLLIAECLTPRELSDYVSLCNELGLAALVELFDADNLPAVLASGAKIVGVNNRDLRTFHTNIDHTLRLRDKVPGDRIFVSESGIRTRAEVDRLKAAGVHAILVGETLLRSASPAAAIHELVGDV